MNVTLQLRVEVGGKLRGIGKSIEGKIKMNINPHPTFYITSRIF